MMLAFFNNFDYATFAAGCHAINYWAFWCGFVLVTGGLLVTLQNGPPEPEKKVLSIWGFIPMVALMVFWYPPAGQGTGIVEAMWEICYAGDGGDYGGAGNLTQLIGAPQQFSNSALVVGDTSSIEGKMTTVLAIETMLMVAREQQQNKASTQGWGDSLAHMAGLGGLGFVYLGYILYHLSLMVFGAFGPFFFGMMAFPQTRHIGFGFLLSTVSTALWPVGWAFTSFVTDFLLNEAITALGTTAALSAITSLLGSAGGLSTGTPLDSALSSVVNNTGAIQWSAMAGGWMVMSTVSIPLFLQSLFSFGAASFGASLSQGAQGSQLGQMLSGRGAASLSSDAPAAAGAARAGQTVVRPGGPGQPPITMQTGA